MEINLADSSSIKRTKKVFKLQDNSDQFIEVGILNDKNDSVVFYDQYLRRK